MAQMERSAKKLPANLQNRNFKAEADAAKTPEERDRLLNLRTAKLAAMERIGDKNAAKYAKGDEMARATAGARAAIKKSTDTVARVKGEQAAGRKARRQERARAQRDAVASTIKKVPRTIERAAETVSRVSNRAGVKAPKPAPTNVKALAKRTADSVKRITKRATGR